MIQQNYAVENIDTMKLLELEAKSFLDLCTQFDNFIENKFPAQTIQAKN